MDIKISGKTDKHQAGIGTYNKEEKLNKFIQTSGQHPPFMRFLGQGCPN